MRDIGKIKTIVTIRIKINVNWTNWKWRIVTHQRIIKLAIDVNLIKRTRIRGLIKITLRKLRKRIFFKTIDRWINRKKLSVVKSNKSNTR